MAFVTIKDIPEAQALIEHLRTLKYVKFISEPTKRVVNSKRSERKIVADVKKSEKSGRIDWAKAKKEIATWK